MVKKLKPYPGDLPGEEWRGTESFGTDARYEVSNRGRFRSWVSRKGPGEWRPFPRLMSVPKDPDGRPFAKYLDPAGNKKQTPVCQLVAHVFNGTRPEGLIIRHLNGDPTDNRPENLAYGTARENTEDCIAHGTMPRGERSGSSKMTRAQVLEARKRYDDGEPVGALLPDYPVERTTLRKIVTRQTWRHVPEPGSGSEGAE